MSIVIDKSHYKMFKEMNPNASHIDYYNRLATISPSATGSEMTANGMYVPTEVAHQPANKMVGG